MYSSANPTELPDHSAVDPPEMSAASQGDFSEGSRPASDLIDSINAELQRQQTRNCARFDRGFALLMLVQWFAAIGIALWIGPLAWAGDTSYLHPHVTLAIFYGGMLTLVPVVLSRIAAGQSITRLTIAATQMLMSGLLIHLTGGRIETHFHIFGSLAFLAFYLDWQVLVLASVVIAVDHLLRALFLPFSVFGSDSVELGRWLEHLGWVVFCDVFLIFACRSGRRTLRELATRHVEREELLKRAHYDPLTGLPNRSLLSLKISESISRASSAETGFSCLYIDLDRFKDINDQLGHNAGDTILRMVAERMKSRMTGEIFLARLSGDEFAALVPHSRAEPDRCEAFARSILRSLLQPFVLGGREWVLGASIGISSYPRDGQDEAELLASSDRAMYRVKRSGRNGLLVYSPAGLEEDRKRQEAELLRAIAEGEFQLFYQPIFRADGSIASLEALLRWITNPADSVHRAISPGYFIPLAEVTGLIVQLGSFVLHQACQQATEWRRRGLLPGSIAVNVSSLELARQDFSNAVLLTLRQHGTPADAIELEVTESALVNDFALAEQHLKLLRQHGIKISIDDFGTGYSSLGRLRQLTLDTLKIDRIFIEGVASSEADRTVVEHIIAMAHTLGMKVVAEGVETETQRQILAALGCDQLQGFFFARPANRETTETFLLQHPARENFDPPEGKETSASVS
jgi:diguanylate cyclase (GGDEF)-like protein